MGFAFCTFRRSPRRYNQLLGHLFCSAKCKHLVEFDEARATRDRTPSKINVALVDKMNVRGGRKAEGGEGERECRERTEKKEANEEGGGRGEGGRERENTPVCRAAVLMSESITGASSHSQTGHVSGSHASREHRDRLQQRVAATGACRSNSRTGSLIVPSSLVAFASATRSPGRHGLTPLRASLCIPSTPAAPTCTLVAGPSIRHVAWNCCTQDGTRCCGLLQIACLPKAGHAGSESCL